jgi:hypothetical protein
VADGGALDPVVDGHPVLRAALADGKGCAPYEFLFPEVFFPGGDPAASRGFDAVVGNPPWDRALPYEKEFYAAFDLRVLDAPTKRERDVAVAQLKTDPRIADAHAKYLSSFRSFERVVDRLYQHQVVDVEGESTIGKQDLYRLFMERGLALVASGGLTGIIVPSAFHANEGATGVRRLYIEENALRCCYSFENRRKLFEIHSSFKFAAVVCERGADVDAFPCAFYLQDLEWLFSGEQPLRYTREFVKATGGPYLTLLELRGPDDAKIAEKAYRSPITYLSLTRSLAMELGREINMTDDAHRFTPAPTVTKEDARDPGVASALLAQLLFR